MVGKRRPHKTKPPYKRIVGKGLETEDQAAEDLQTVADAVSTCNIDTSDSSGTYTSDSNGHRIRESPPDPDRRSLEFPLEIIDLICSHASKKFPLLFVNKRWHSMAVGHVYADPELTPVNFPLFVQAITDDKYLGESVRSLDLTKIAQVGRNSMVARLLRRCSPKLETFVAPQSHFGFSPMLSLAACHRMRYLNLSLVCETLDLPQLFNTIKNFHDLEILYFPRSSIKWDDEADIAWAPNLRQLSLSGGFPAAFLEQTTFPPSLTALEISNCPYLTTGALNRLLDKVGNQLQRLVLAYPVPYLKADALDIVLMQCRNLTALQVSIDYISSMAFEHDLIPTNHPLKHLSILSSGLMGHSTKIKPSHILMATDKLTDLTRVSVSLLMGWNQESRYMHGLIDILEERGGGVWVI